jgi:hypothetical protein
MRSCRRDPDSEHPVIVEDFGKGITTKTQVQATRIVYQILKNGIVTWQRTVELGRGKTNQYERRQMALTQDGLAKSMADEVKL